MKFFTTNCCKTLHMIFHWLILNFIIEMTTIGIIIKTLGNVIIYDLPLSQSASDTSYIAKPVKQFPSGLDRFLECQKCNILVITQVLVLCPTYMHSPLGLCASGVMRIRSYIRQSTLIPIIYIYICM